MIRRPIFLVAILLGIVLPHDQAEARDPSCRHLAGSVIAIDTLYGMGLGALVGGLWVVATDRKQNVESRLASGALAGGALGMGFGFYEVANRNCKLVISENSSHKIMPALVYEPLASGWSLSLRYQF